MIYMMIAGSYTPYCLVAIRGALGWTLFGIIWAMAIAGIVYKSIWLNKKSHLLNHDLRNHGLDVSHCLSALVA